MSTWKWRCVICLRLAVEAPLNERNLCRDCAAGKWKRD